LQMWFSREQRAKSGEVKEMTRFRFENLIIWQRSSDIAGKLFLLANILEERKLYRFADQMRGAGLSMPNNIAEGSGSTSKNEFVQFLNIARRSTFENASMLIVLAKNGFIPQSTMEELLKDLDELCRMITAFSRSLKSKDVGPKKEK
jgi:four helix bundle protein